MAQIGHDNERNDEDDNTTDAILQICLDIFDDQKKCDDGNNLNNNNHGNHKFTFDNVSDVAK